MSTEEYEKKKLAIETKANEKLKKLKEKQRDMDAAKTTSAGISASIESYKNAGGWPWGVVPAGVMTALWVSAVAEIKSQKFQEGGIIEGASHAQGGVPVKVGNKGYIEAEGREPILKKEVSGYQPTLDLANFANTYHRGNKLQGSKDLSAVKLYYKNGRSALLSSKRGRSSIQSAFMEQGGIAGGLNSGVQSGSQQGNIIRVEPKFTAKLGISKGQLVAMIEQEKQSLEQSGADFGI